MKVLILRFSSIGDIVLTSPIVRCLKAQLPEIEIHYATKKNFKSILEHNPYISKLHFLEENEKSLIKSLKAEKFDFIIDLHKNVRTFRIKKSLFGVPSDSFNKLNFKKALLVNLKINQLPDIHIVDRYFQAVKKLNVKNDEAGLDYFYPEGDFYSITDQFPDFKIFSAFSIGGQHQTKRLPLKKQIELCEKIEGKIVLLGGKEDFEDAKAIEDQISKNNKVLNLVGKLNLNQSASVLKQANKVFTHDTGLMHIAAAFKREIIVIWGNTTPDFGMYPYKTQFKNLEVNDLNCRPCSKIGFDKCPKEHFHCMQHQNFDNI